MADLSWVSDSLTAGSRDGTGIVPGDLGPEDILATKVKELLEADADVSGAVNAVTRWPTLPFWTFQDLPQIYVYSGSTVSENAPTKVYKEQIDIFVSIVLKLDDMPQMADWAPGLPSVVRAIRKVLGTNQQMADTCNSQTVQLARKAQMGPISWLVDERQAGTITGILEMAWSYSVIVDQEEAQLKEIVRALAATTDPKQLQTQDGLDLQTQDGIDLETQG